MSTPQECAFWRKVDCEGPLLSPYLGRCWVWTGALNWGGYASTTFKGRQVKVHRLVYEMMRDPIPNGLHLDHLCRVRNCCNPAHLEPVTNAENARRGNLNVWQKQKTHCINGHEFDVANTLHVGNKRRCKKCINARKKRWRERTGRTPRGTT